MIKGIVAGVVTKSALDKSKSGKPFAKLRVETSKPGFDRDGNSRTYKSRVDVHVYGHDTTAAAEIPVGSIVWAEGEASAKVDEWQGKTYAKLQIVGKVGVLNGADFEKHKREFEAGQQTLEPRQNTPKPAANSAGQEPTPPEEDDVPF